MNNGDLDGLLGFKFGWKKDFAVRERPWTSL
jgi:hypothetical protein